MTWNQISKIKKRKEEYAEHIRPLLDGNGYVFCNMTSASSFDVCEKYKNCLICPISIFLEDWDEDQNEGLLKDIYLHKTMFFVNERIWKS